MHIAPIWVVPDDVLVEIHDRQIVRYLFSCTSSSCPDRGPRQDRKGFEILILAGGYFDIAAWYLSLGVGIKVMWDLFIFSWSSICS